MLAAQPASTWQMQDGLLGFFIAPTRWQSPAGTGSTARPKYVLLGAIVTHWEIGRRCRRLASRSFPKAQFAFKWLFDSRNSASHNAFHTLLRPSSMFEPRHQSLKVDLYEEQQQQQQQLRSYFDTWQKSNADAWKRTPYPTALECCTIDYHGPSTHSDNSQCSNGRMRMILPQVHLRKPCYDFSFL